jgi:nucleotide-binding universal stress UspA family protein
MSYNHILVGYDGSPGAKRALLTAGFLGRKFAASIWVVWIREPLPCYYANPNGEANAATDFFKDVAEDVGEFSETHQIKIRCEKVRGDPAQELVQRASDGKVDLIIIGNSGQSGLWGSSLGHVADRVSEHAECDVMVVR